MCTVNFPTNSYTKSAIQRLPTTTCSILGLSKNKECTVRILKYRLNFTVYFSNEFWIPGLVNINHINSIKGLLFFCPVKTINRKKLDKSFLYYMVSYMSCQFCKTIINLKIIAKNTSPLALQTKIRILRVFHLIGK